MSSLKVMYELNFFRMATPTLVFCDWMKVSTEVRPLLTENGNGCVDVGVHDFLPEVHLRAGLSHSDETLQVTRHDVDSSNVLTFSSHF